MDYATAQGPEGVVLGDINADGKPDLVVACSNGTAVTVLLNNGNGTFAPRVDYNGGNNPPSVAIADLDADGYPDLAVASANSSSVNVLRNNGDGTFAPRVNFNASGTPTWVAIRDLDADGRPDLAVTNAVTNRLSVLRNTSTGPGNIAFATNVIFNTGTGPASVSIDDLNADGKPDLAVPNTVSNTVSVFINASSGPTNISFAPRVDYTGGLSPRAASIRDLDNDGWPDLAVAIYDANTVSVLRNNGNGTFAAAENFATGAGPRAVALGDLDADGRADIVVANSNNASLTVLRNKSFTVGYVRAGLTTGLDDGSSWANAYRELRTALTDLQAAPWVRELWVASGTYTPASPNGPRTASFSLRSNLAIYGGFAGNEASLSQRNITQNPTVLSGDLNANDLPNGLNRAENALSVVTADGVDNAVLDGFTVSSGNADGGNGVTSGGGLRISGSGSVLTRNTTFFDNRAFDLGGGVLVQGNATRGFDRCTFVANVASQRGGGGLAVLGAGSRARIVNSHFEANHATGPLAPASSGNGGGVLAHDGGQIELVKSVFLRNTATQTGGGAASQLSSSTIARVSGVSCQFLGNTAKYGGGLGASQFAEAVLDGCLIVGNRAVGTGAVGGGVMLNEGGQVRLSHCTVASNHANTRGGGVAVLNAVSGPLVLLHNSLLWHNTSPDSIETAQISPGTFTSLFIRNCFVQGWTGTTFVASGIENNTATNPLFLNVPSAGPDAEWGTVDDNYGNLRLPQNSPAIDNATGGPNPNPLLPPDTIDLDFDGDATEFLPLDLDGSPRIQNGTVDRGCYEGFRCPTCPQDRQWFTAQSGAWSDDPRWSFSTPTSCLYALLDAAGQPYTINFNNADAARGLLHTRNTVTLSAPALSDTLTLRPPGIGATCPNGVPQTFRPALLVSGAILDNPTLNITSGTVSASSGFIAEPFGEIGTINVAGPDAKLTFASGTCSIGDQGEGTLTVQAGATVAAGFFFVGQGDIDSEPDGVFDLHGSILIDGPGSTLKPKFSLNITHGTVTVRNQGLIDCGTTGTVFVLPGSSLTGDGQVIGRVVNFGDVAPEDNDPGATAGAGIFQPKALAITSPPGGATNAYEQLGTDPKDGPRTGTLRLRTGDSAGAILADSLVINGNAKIAGTLVVEPVGDFVPATNAPAATLLTAAAVQGRFDLAVFPGVGGDRFMRLSYSGTTSERGAGVSVAVAPLSSNINLDPPSSANVGGVPTDIVAADFDNDPSNTLDLALTVPDATNPTTAPGTVVILRNAGNTGPGGSWAGFTGGQLTFNVGVNPRGLAKGDFNADGVPDLAVANAGSNSLTVLRNLNNGTGAMTTNQTIAVGTSPVAVVTGVFRDSSSAIDVAVVNQGSNSITILNNTSGTLATAATLSTGEAPSDITAAQLDSGSSTLDLAVTNRDDDTVTVFYRPPAAGFPSLPSRILPVGPRPVQIEPGGLDNPKEINDLCVTNFNGGSTSILLNNNLTGGGPGGAGFQPKADLPTGTNPDSITLGDLDNDGDPDLSVVTTVNAQRVVRVFRNDVQQVSPGEYQAAFAPFDDAYAGTDPRLVIAGDVNIDGRDDLIAVNDQSLVFRTAAGAAPGTEPERVLVQQPNVSTSLSLAPNIPAPCPGDLVPVGGDNAVNTADLVAFLGQFGRTCANLPQGARCGDFNNDNTINTADLVFFLGRFGQPCP